MNFSDPEGYIDSSDDPPLPDGAFLHCTYTVTVYTGYGVELQVNNNNNNRHSLQLDQHTLTVSRVSGEHHREREVCLRLSL